MNLSENANESETINQLFFLYSEKGLWVKPQEVHSQHFCEVNSKFSEEVKANPLLLADLPLHCY